MTNPTEENGWVEIGKRCSAGRRSMWLKLKMFSNNAIIYSKDTVESIEVCAGREGDDSHIIITHDCNMFDELLDLFTTAQYAATT